MDAAKQLTALLNNMFATVRGFPRWMTADFLYFGPICAEFRWWLTNCALLWC
jgi:hypothetical protein